MRTFRNDSEKEKAQTSNWEKLFVLTRYWKSDLEFYLEDMHFLHKLIGKYSIWLKRKKNSEAVNKVSMDLEKLTKKGQILLNRVKNHIVKTGNLINHNDEKDSEVVLKDHEALENEIAQFVNDFRSNRREVFKISEKVIDSENLTDLMQK